MDFSDALEMIKDGFHLMRQGWNAVDQFVYYMPGYPDGVPAHKGTAHALGIEEGTIVHVRPYLGFRTAQGEIVPWVATQSDLLAKDWITV